MSECCHMVKKTRTPGHVFSKNQGCPFTRNNSVWCYGVCAPVNGVGLCGRLAHHAIKGRTQRAIVAQQDRDGCDFDPTELDAPELWRRNGAW